MSIVSDTQDNSLKNLKHCYVLAKSHHYGHQESFQKFSNAPGWANILHFSNGGLSVDLLRLDKKRESRAKATLQAYMDID